MQLKSTHTHCLWVVIGWLWVIFSSSIFAAQNKTPLSSDRAFDFSMTLPAPQEIMLTWHIAPHYYLYRDRVNVTFSPIIPATVHFPKGIIKQDVDRGAYEVYTGNLSIPITLNTYEKTVQMRVSYQGCSAQGFCYPPINKNISVNLSSFAAPFTLTHVSMAQTSWSVLLTDQNKIRSLFTTQHLVVMLIIFMGIGLLLAFTPCVLPMVPILTAIILGQQVAISTKKAFLLSLTYVLGMAITYAFAGLVVVVLGNSIQVTLQKPLFILLGSGVFLLLALSLFGIYDLRLPRVWQNKFNRWSNKHKGGTYLGVFCMGILSTLIVSPCVTAPLVGVLLYVAQTGDKIIGASSLFMMGIGMGIPLLLIGSSAGRFLPKTGPWMEAIKKLMGIVMLAIAVWMLSRIVSPNVTAILVGIICLIVALFFSMYLPQLMGWKRLNRSVGSLAGALGLLLIAGAILHPGRIPEQNLRNPFIVVRDIQDLHKQLAIAQARQKPVLLDFYADWCESCVIMDKNVFSKSEVVQALNHFVLLRADLSENTSNDEALLKNFNVIAPPTVLLFDRGGQEVNSQRIVGEINKQEFLNRLTTFIAANCDKKMHC